MSGNNQLAGLRELLAERFPTAELRESGVLPTGLPAFDEAEGGLRRGVVTELTGPSSSGALFIEAMLAALQRERGFGVLVEVGGGFDPQGAETTALPRLLWVRCAEAMQAVKAVDLLIRDGNLGLVLLDLQALPLREVRRVPASTWHRFQRLLEPSGTALVVLTAQPLVEGARVRIALRQRWTLEAMRQRRNTLLGQLAPQVFIRREFSLVEEESDTGLRPVKEVVDFQKRAPTTVSQRPALPTARTGRRPVLLPLPKAEPGTHRPEARVTFL